MSDTNTKGHKLIFYRETSSGRWDEFEPKSREVIFLSDTHYTAHELRKLAYAVAQHMKEHDSGSNSWLLEVDTALDAMLESEKFKHLSALRVHSSDVDISDITC